MSDFAGSRSRTPWFTVLIGAGSAESNNVLIQMETEGSKLAAERMLREFTRSGLMPPPDEE